jgi:hypothetical protein
VRERRSPLTPDYTWSDASQRYRNTSTGKFIKREVVRRALDTALDRSRNEVQRLSRALVNGNMSIAEWQLSTAKEIKSMHLASASLAKGGWAQMGPREFGKVGNTLRNEYGYLAKFGEQVKSGEQKLDGSLISRANLYAQGSRGTYHAIEAQGMLAEGKEQCRNVLGGSDHNCQGCLDETAKGWQMVGEMIPIGERECMANCRCSVEYR